MNDGPNPLTWDTQLLSYWFSRNPAVFQDSILRHREISRAKDLPASPRTMFRVQRSKCQKCPTEPCTLQQSSVMPSFSVHGFILLLSRLWCMYCSEWI
jgi:hypothetical protein